MSAEGDSHRKIRMASTSALRCSRRDVARPRPPCCGCGSQWRNRGEGGESASGETNERSGAGAKMLNPAEPTGTGARKEGPARWVSRAGKRAGRLFSVRSPHRRKPGSWFRPKLTPWRTSLLNARRLQFPRDRKVPLAALFCLSVLLHYCPTLYIIVSQHFSSGLLVLLDILRRHLPGPGFREYPHGGREVRPEQLCRPLAVPAFDAGQDRAVLS
jgi:hypothetical protein